MTEPTLSSIGFVSGAKEFHHPHRDITCRECSTAGEQCEWTPEWLKMSHMHKGRICVRCRTSKLRCSLASREVRYKIVSATEVHSIVIEKAKSKSGSETPNVGPSTELVPPQPQPAGEPSQPQQQQQTVTLNYPHPGVDDVFGGLEPLSTTNQWTIPQFIDSHPTGSSTAGPSNAPIHTPTRLLPPLTSDATQWKGVMRPPRTNLDEISKDRRESAADIGTQIGSWVENIITKRDQEDEVAHRQELKVRDERIGELQRENARLQADVKSLSEKCLKRKREMKTNAQAHAAEIKELQDQLAASNAVARSFKDLLEERQNQDDGDPSDTSDGD